MEISSKEGDDGQTLFFKIQFSKLRRPNITEKLQ